MIGYIKKKIKRKQLKHTFSEYGFEIKKFHTNLLGDVEYAQWLHPFDKPKEVTDSKISFYKKLCKNGEMIVDIGAHTGDTTVPMACAVGKEGLVLGLEPNKYVYQILEKNSELNKDFTNIVPLCFAAVSEEGVFSFNYSDASFCNGGFLSQIKSKKHKHNYTLDVEGKNLQKYLFENYKDELKKLSLIKIDAEGYDKEILITLPNILEEYRPALMIECYKRLTSDEREELFFIVDDNGYELYYLENFEVFNELKRIHKHNMADEKHFEMLAIHKTKKTEYEIEFRK